MALSGHGDEESEIYWRCVFFSECFGVGSECCLSFVEVGLRRVCRWGVGESNC